MSGRIDEAVRRNVAIAKAIEENNRDISKHVSVALGQLAYQVKQDVMHINQRLTALEERFNMVNGHQGGLTGGGAGTP